MKHSECSRTSTGAAGIGRADHDRQMLDAAVARAERDEAGVLGVGERHARLGDAGQSGCSRHRRLNTARGLDAGEIAAAREQRRLGGADAAAPAPPAAARRAWPGRPRPARRARRRPAAGPSPGGSAPSEAPGSARLRITAAGIRATPRSSSRPTEPRAGRGRARRRGGGSTRRAARSAKPGAAGAGCRRSPTRRRSTSTRASRRRAAPARRGATR